MGDFADAVVDVSNYWKSFGTLGAEIFRVVRIGQSGVNMYECGLGSVASMELDVLLPSLRRQ
jgi:hypothetical protein